MKLSEIATMLQGELIGGADPEISGAAGLSDARAGDLSFITDNSHLEALKLTQASAVIIPPGIDSHLPAIRLSKPYIGFADFLKNFEISLDRVFPRGIHETAVVHETADVSEAVSIGPYCVIGAGCSVGQGTRLADHVSLGPDVTIGQDCRLYSRVAIRENCQVGSRVVLHAGVCLGTDGFGFLPGPEGLKKIPQVGIVQIEDDVEIGSGSCVDRATTGITRVGQGTKLDNLVQVGHNVKVGSHCVISAHTGIGGSSVIGNGVAIGGLVGIADHVNIGDGAQIAGKSGMFKDVPAGATVFGVPAIDVKESFRLFSAMRKLPELIRKVRMLEGSVGASSQTSSESKNNPGPAGNSARKGDNP